MNKAWLLGLVACVGLESCSSVTVLRTRELNKVGADVKAEVLAQTRLQLDSLRRTVDSLRTENQRLQKRLVADVATLNTTVGNGFDQLRSSNEEILFRLDQLAQTSAKPTKRVVVNKKAEAETGAPVTSDSTLTKPTTTTPVVDTTSTVQEGFDPELDKLYTTGRSDFQRGEYKLAYDGFKQIFEKSKTGPYAENALYWMGLCLSETNQADKALVVFQRVLELFPRGKKSCVVLMKLAQLSEAASKKDDQVRYLQGLTSQEQCRESNEAYKAIELLDTLKAAK